MQEEFRARPCAYGFEVLSGAVYIFQSAPRPVLLPRQTSRRRRPPAHDLSKDDDLAQVMSIVIRHMNYGISFCHVGKRLNFQRGNDSLVQVAGFCHFHETFEIVDEPRSQRRPCVPMDLRPTFCCLLGDRFAHAETAHCLVRRHILNCSRRRNMGSSIDQEFSDMHCRTIQARSFRLVCSVAALPVFSGPLQFENFILKSQCSLTSCVTHKQWL